VLLDDLPPISTVLWSHNHYDHCDLRTLRLLAKRFDPMVVTPLALVRSAGVRRVEELDWWQEANTSALFRNIRGTAENGCPLGPVGLTNRLPSK
jgi:L-ascorbate metabolism protein UlaG (beta-lactamase superfamily)